MPDWTDEVADSIENAVVMVRDKTVVPVERIVAYVVAGLFLLFLVTAARNPGVGGCLPARRRLPAERLVGDLAGLRRSIHGRRLVAAVITPLASRGD